MADNDKLILLSVFETYQAAFMENKTCVIS